MGNCFILFLFSKYSMQSIVIFNQFIRNIFVNLILKKKKQAFFHILLHFKSFLFFVSYNCLEYRQITLQYKYISNLNYLFIESFGFKFINFNIVKFYRDNIFIILVRLLVA